ncbi:MAG: hypothetical protein RL071_4508 [Pseudomonadota bacterium]|jgi:uncharacterized membrane protein YedE/YeeE
MPESSPPPVFVDSAADGLLASLGAFGPALAGGVLIGLSTALLLLLTGRIAGISGVLGGLLTPRAGDIGWRAAFVGGLLLAGAGAALLAPAALGAPLARAPVFIVVAGLLVGFGTRLGNGCTSGHGVCGISRGSPRSLASVLTFMATGIATATLLRLIGVSA